MVKIDELSEIEENIFSEYETCTKDFEYIELVNAVAHCHDIIKRLLEVVYDLEGDR